MGKDLVFLDDLKKEEDKKDKKDSKQTLELKRLRDLVDKGLYKPDLDKVAEAFIEKELQMEEPEPPEAIDLKE